MINDRYAYANLVAAKVARNGAPEQVRVQVRAAFSTAVNPRVVRVAPQPGSWLEGGAVLAIPRGAPKERKRWRWTFVAMRRRGEEVDLVALPVRLPRSFWDGLWEDDREARDRADGVIDGRLALEAGKLGVRPFPAIVEGICGSAEGYSAEMLTGSAPWENPEGRLGDLSSGLRGLRPRAWKPIIAQACGTAMWAARQEVLPRNAGEPSELSVGEKFFDVGAGSAGDRIMLGSWHAIWWEWLREMLPEEVRKVWHALSGSPLTNPWMEHGGVLAVALMSGSEEHCERKLRMVRRYPLGAALWLLDVEARRLVEEGKRERELWERASQNLRLWLEKEDRHEQVCGMPIPYDGLRRLCRSQWGQRVGGAGFRIMALVAGEPAEHQPKRLVEWREWSCADRVVDGLFEWDEHGHSMFADHVRRIYRGLAHGSRGLTAAERKQRCEVLTEDARECRDALYQLKQSFYRLRACANAEEAEELGRKLFRGLPTVNEVRRVADRWRRSHLEIQERAQRSLDRLREEDPGMERERVEWPSPEVKLDGVVALTTPDALYAQGAIQDHCVGGYVWDCLHKSDNLHIYAIGDPRTTGTTLGVLETHDGRVKAGQHFGRRNSAPSPAARRTALRVLGVIRQMIGDGSYDRAAARNARKRMRAVNDAGGNQVRERLRAAAVIAVMGRGVSDLEEIARVVEVGILGEVLGDKG